MDLSLHASLTNFAARFCNELEKGSSSVCSPLSAQAVLALTALGCAGASRDELLRAMDFADDDHIRKSFGFVVPKLKALQGVTLKMANKVYVTNTGTLKPEIQKDAEEVFHSDVEQLDFTQTGAATDINKWVAEHTNNMIRDMVSPGDLSGNTGLLLLNAIYFQGFWHTQFSKESTKPRTFYLNNKTEIKVPMMSLEDTKFEYKHSPELKAKIVRMPYKGHVTGLMIVLPDEVEGLGDVMQQLAAGHDLIKDITSPCGLQNTPLDLMVPKFKVETDIDLKELLPKLGIKSIFDKKEIQMLTSGPPQFVSKAVQKAVIQVDEMGSEATVCMSNFMTCVSTNWRPPVKQEFIADRPFLYVLMAGYFPLFIGVYRGIGCSEPDATYEDDPVDMTVDRRSD